MQALNLANCDTECFLPLEDPCYVKARNYLLDGVIFQSCKEWINKFNNSFSCLFFSLIYCQNGSLILYTPIIVALVMTSLFNTADNHFYR